MSIVPLKLLKSRVDAILDGDEETKKKKEKKEKRRNKARLCSVHGTSVERVEQLGPVGQGLSRLGIAEPISIPLVLLGPLGLLLLDRGFEEMVRGLGGLRRELVGSPLLRDEAEVVVDFAYYARLFPGLALGGVLGRRLVCFPAALGEDPATALGRLDEEHVVLVGRKRHHAGD